MNAKAFHLITLLVVVCCVTLAESKAAEPQETTNSIGLKLVLIPPGEFWMGGVESAEDLVQAFPAYKRPADFFKDEYPRHRVRITRPFKMGKFEVTVGQFRLFVAETGYKTEAETDGQGGWGFDSAQGKCRGRDVKFNWKQPGFAQTDEHPVIDVTWNDAVAFCRWLSRKEGRTYRLPTEAEWEYACRAGTTTRYNIGNSVKDVVRAANIGDDRGRTTFPHVQELDIPKDSRVKFTLPVGGFPPNRFGLCDMHGNVWEWCSDWYGADYYAHSPTDDPAGPASGTKRVRRGAAWHSYPLWVRTPFRNWNSPGSRCVNLGFRVVEETK